TEYLPSCSPTPYIACSYSAEPGRGGRSNLKPWVGIPAGSHREARETRPAADDLGRKRHMIMRCVAVVLVTAGCAWGLAGCKKGAKADETYKQNAQALVTALEACRKDLEQKAPPQQLTKDYNAAQAARKTFEAACTPE